MPLFTLDFFRKYVSNSDLTDTRVIFIPYQNLSGEKLVEDKQQQEQAASSSLAALVELTNVEIVNLVHNQLNSTVFSTLFQCFPNAWWIDLSHNNLLNLEKVDFPLALGSLDLRQNKRLRFANHQFPSSLVNCHLLRLSITPKTLGYQEENINDDWRLINKIITELPNVWVFNQEFISLKERTYVLHHQSMLSEAKDPSSSKNKNNNNQGSSTFSSEWKNTQPTLRQLLILHSIQSLQFINEKNDYQRLDILLEEYLTQALVFNQYVHHFIVNNNSKIKYIQYQPTILYLDFLLLLPHKVRLDLSVLFTIAVLFPIPEVIFKETLILLLATHYPLDAIDELIYLPSFVKTAVVSLIRRITKREQEEFKTNLFLKKKQVSSVNDYKQFIKENKQFPIATNYSSHQSFHFLKNIKYYLEDISITAGNVPASLLPSEEVLSKNFQLTELETEILTKLPDIPTKWCKFRHFPSEEHQYTLYNIDYIPWISFAARHIIFLFNKCPSCPALTRLPNNILQQNIYFDLLPILKAANMTLSDLEITNYGPMIDGRCVNNLFRTMNIHPTVTTPAGGGGGGGGGGAVTAVTVTEEERKHQLLDEMSDTTHGDLLSISDDLEGNPHEIHKSKRRKRLESALLYLDGKILPFGEGLIAGSPGQLIWSKPDYAEQMRSYQKPWNPSVPVIYETEQQNDDNQKAFFITTGNNTNNNTSSERPKSQYSGLNRQGSYRLSPEFKDSYIASKNPAENGDFPNPFLTNRPVTIDLAPMYADILEESSPHSALNRSRSLILSPPSSPQSLRSRHHANHGGSTVSLNANNTVSQYSSLWQAENFNEASKVPDLFPPEFRPHSFSSQFQQGSAATPSSATKELKITVQSTQPGISKSKSSSSMADQHHPAPPHLLPEAGIRSTDSYEEDILSGLHDILSVNLDEFSIGSVPEILKPSAENSPTPLNPVIEERRRNSEGGNPRSLVNIAMPSLSNSAFELEEDSPVDSVKDPNHEKKKGLSTGASTPEEVVMETEDILHALKSSKTAHDTLLNLRKSIRNSAELEEALNNEGLIGAPVQASGSKDRLVDIPDDHSLSDESSVVETGPHRADEQQALPTATLKAKRVSYVDTASNENKNQENQPLGDENDRGLTINTTLNQYQQTANNNNNTNNRSIAQMIPRNGKLHKIDVFSADLLMDAHFLLAPTRAIQTFNHFFKYSALEYDQETMDLTREIQHPDNMLNYWRKLENPPVVALNNKNITINQQIPQKTFNYYVNNKKKKNKILQATWKTKALKQTAEMTEYRQQLVTELHERQQQWQSEQEQLQQSERPSTEQRNRSRTISGQSFPSSGRGSPVSFSGTDFKSQPDRAASPSVLMPPSAPGTARPSTTLSENHTSTANITILDGTRVTATLQGDRYHYTIEGDNISVDDSIAFSEITHSVAQTPSQRNGMNSPPPSRGARSSTIEEQQEEKELTYSPEKPPLTKRQQSESLSASFLVAIQAMEDSDDENPEGGKILDPTTTTITPNKEKDSNQPAALVLLPSSQQPEPAPPTTVEHHPTALETNTNRSRPVSTQFGYSTRPIFSTAPLIRLKTGHSSSNPPTARSDVHTPFGREILTPEADELLRDMGTFRNVTQLQTFNTFVHNLQLSQNGKIIDTMRSSDHQLYPHYQVSALFKRPSELYGQIPDPSSASLMSGHTSLSAEFGHLHSPISVEGGGGGGLEGKSVHSLDSQGFMIDPNFDLHTISEKSYSDDSFHHRLQQQQQHLPGILTKSSSQPAFTSIANTANWKDSLLWLKNLKTTSFTDGQIRSFGNIHQPANTMLSQSMPLLPLSNKEFPQSPPSPSRKPDPSFFMTDVKNQPEYNQSRPNTTTTSAPSTAGSRPLTEQGNDNVISFYNIERAMEGDAPDAERTAANEEYYQAIVDQSVTVNNDTKHAFATLQLRDQSQYPYIYTTSTLEEYPMGGDLNYYHPKKKPINYYPILPKTIYKIQPPSNLIIPTATSNNIDSNNNTNTLSSPKPPTTSIDLETNQKNHDNKLQKKSSKKVLKAPLDPAVFQNDDLSSAPFHYRDHHNENHDHDDTEGDHHPSSPFKSKQTRRTSSGKPGGESISKESKNLQILSETSQYFKSMISSSAAVAAAAAERNQNRIKDVSGVLSNLSHSFGGGDSQFSVAARGGGSSGITEVRRERSKVSQEESIPAMTINESSHDGRSSFARPSSSSVHHIVTHLRQTIPTTPLPPSRSPLGSPLPSSSLRKKGPKTNNPKQLGIAEYNLDQGKLSHRTASLPHHKGRGGGGKGGIALQLKGESFSQLPSGSQFTSSITSMVNEGNNNSKTNPAAKPKLIRPRYASPNNSNLVGLSHHLSHLTAETNHTPMSNDEADSFRSGVISRPSSDAMYQLDNQAIYQAYHAHISPNKFEQSDSNLFQFNDESPVVSRVNSHHIEGFRTVNTNNNSRDLLLPAAGGGSSSPTNKDGVRINRTGQDKFFEKDVITIKPHRRLRALSAEKKSIDHNHIPQVNTVWVGMKNYKAATHKLALNHSFRVKLPSLQQQIGGSGDGQSSSLQQESRSTSFSRSPSGSPARSRQSVNDQ